MATVEQDRIALNGDYHLLVEMVDDTWRGKDTVKFYAVQGDPPDDERERRRWWREAPEVEVTPPFSNLHRYRQWEPSDEPEYGFITTDNTRLEPGGAKAVGEMLTLAADYLNAMHVQQSERLLEQERLHKEHLEKELAEQRAKQELRSKLKEELQWYVGQQFKLKREGYKATVFGTIDRFTDTHVYTTSERGVRMDTRIDDIYFFAIKYEGEKRYTTVYEREPRRRA